MSKQNDIEHILDLLDRGVITTAQGNVRMVRNERFRVIKKLSRSVRVALNAAVKSGELAHMKKDDMKPEVYYHPDFEHLAHKERREFERKVIEALAAVCIPGSHLESKT